MSWQNAKERMNPAIETETGLLGHGTGILGQIPVPMNIFIKHFPNAKDQITLPDLKVGYS